MFGLLSEVCSSVYNFVIGVEALQDARSVEGTGDFLENIEKKCKTNVPSEETAASTEESSKEKGADDISRNDPENNKTFYGIVTHLYSGRGLIDDHIYFSQDTVIGNARLKVGTKVTVEATRTNQQGGWVAKVVSLFNEWNLESEDIEKSDEINGIVTYFKGVSGLINDRYSFSKGSCKAIYHPMVNDFVTCEVRTAGGLDGEIVSVKPLREKVFVGYVTNVINRYGFIDEDVFFPLGACRGYFPRVGDCVLVTAIESKQRKSQWRAYKVEKCSEDMKLKYGDAEIARPLSGKNLNMGPSYSKYNRRSRERRDEKQDNLILPGQRQTRRKKMFLPKHLKQYGVPKDIQACVLEGGKLEDLVPDVIMPLSMENHRSKLDALLFAEEIEMEEEMREFDMEMVTLRHLGEFLVLSVPGLAEGRPSVMIGDRIVVDIRDSPQNAPRYEGFVHEVRAEDVLFKFNDSFHQTYRSEDCDVQFFFSRTTIRRFHQAVEYSTDLGKCVLFPTTLRTKRPLPQTTNSRNKRGLEFFNKSLNKLQKAAVERILKAECRPTPYLLFGPPGTGKTVTLVEAILQIHKAIKSCRILACAPSNSASDLIAQRLVESKEFSKGELIRLNAMQRSQEIPAVIEPYCTNDTDDIMLKCRYRVIVCTCSMAGILYCAGLQSGHFTHVFVDEAGQATEPECLVAAGMLAGNDDGQLVLAGDPYQLGPVLKSPISLHYGLGISLLERLITSPIYARDDVSFKEHGSYNPLLVTKLVNNYRSHEALLNLSSSLFYHGELLPCANGSLVNSFIGSEFLLDKNFPLIFIGTRGEDMREGNSPSWFNPSEAVEVVKYVQQVLSVPNKDIDTTDIGVITPYRKQVEKIRLLLEGVNLEGVKVGSVEEFQGQERQVIIISTVRSNESFVTFDNRHTLGFLSNPKRFNVALTRAQALLIVIGNPHILCRDPYWCALVQYCVAHSAYSGCELPTLDDPVIKGNFETALAMLGINLQLSDVETSKTEQRFMVDSTPSCTNDHCTKSLSRDGREKVNGGFDVEKIAKYDKHGFRLKKDLNDSWT